MRKKVYLLLAVLGILYMGMYLPQNVYAVTVSDSGSDDNTTAAANQMSVGDTVQGAISETDDLDYYTFTLESAGCVTLKMTAYMQFYCIRLFNADGEEIWYTNYNEWNSNVGYRRDTYELYLEQGTYYMQINGYKYGTDYKSNGIYECETAFLSSQVNNREADNSFASANNISANHKIVGQISEDDACDIYAFSVSEAGCETLKMTSYMQYYCIILFNADGKEIWYTNYNEWNSNVGYRRDTYDLYLEHGTYYLEINGYKYGTEYKSNGKYECEASFASSGTSFNRDDNSFADANLIDISKTYTGQISINDDFDTYRFKVASKTTLPVTITSYMQFYCIKLFNADGGEFWHTDYNEWNSNVGYRKDSHYIVLSPGVYYMQINGYKYGTEYKSSGKYKFSLNAADVKKPNQVKNVKVWQKSKALSLEWDSVPDAQGYQVCYSTSKNFKKKKTMTTTSTNVIISGLKSNKNYYVKVRAYVSANGKKVYGKYSRTVKQKTW